MTVERHLLVKVIDRILFKLDDLVRPYVHKILVVIEPLLIDEDYYARVEGREIISNLSKVRTIHSTMDGILLFHSHCTPMTLDFFFIHFRSFIFRFVFIFRLVQISISISCNFYFCLSQYQFVLVSMSICISFHFYSSQFLVVSISIYICLHFYIY